MEQAVAAEQEKVVAAERQMEEMQAAQAGESAAVIQGLQEELAIANQDMQSQAEDSRDETSQLKDQIDEASATITRLHGELDAAVESNAQWQEYGVQAQAVQDELATEKSRVAELEATIAQSCDSVSEIAQLREQHDKAQASSEKYEAKTKKLQALLKKADGVITEHKTKQKELHDTVSTLEEDSAELTRSQSATEETREAFITDLQDGLNATTEELSQVKAELESSVEQVRKLEEKCRSFEDVQETRLGELQVSAESQWTEKKEALKAEHQAYRKKVQQMMLDKDAVVTKLREQLKAAEARGGGAGGGGASGAAEPPGTPVPIPPQMEPSPVMVMEAANNDAAKYKKGLEESEKAKALLANHIEALKEELSVYERQSKRDAAPQEYLKNIVIAYMENGNHDQLMPVLSTLLQLTPDEVQHVNDERAKRWF